MKKIIHAAAIGLFITTLSACDQSRNSATLGGTQDTSNVTAGANAGGVNAADNADTSNNGNKNRGKDSTSNGNANPSGHLENDTTNQRKNHRP
jgi:hypothetical protein